MKFNRYFLVVFTFLLIINNVLAQLPALSFGNSGNASGCLPHTVVFNISNVAINTPNTTYQLNFGDGSPILNFTQATIPSTVSHTYNSVTCGQTFGGQPNCYGATLTATNPEGSSTGTINPIRISKKPNASFTFSQVSICNGGSITFTNTSDPGVTYSGTTCNTNPPYYWQVTGPDAGVVSSGTLGNNNGFPNNTGAWTIGSSPLTMQFTTPGSYQMKLSIGNGCGIDDTTLNFTVGNISPTISVSNPGNLELCAPGNLDFTLSNFESNSSETIYTVTYGDGGPAQTFNHPPPAIVSHTFTESSCGQTTPSGLNDAFCVQISAENSCGSLIATIEPIHISTPPIANYTGLPAAACVNNLITITSLADLGNNVNALGCNTNNGMLWSISPATGWSLNSGTLGSTNGQPTNYLNWTSGSNQLSIVFSTPGNYTITQRIRNSCGEDIENQTVSITSNGFVNAGFDQSLCLGSAPLQLNGIPAGGIWSGSASLTSIGVFSPNTAGTFALTYIVGTGSCIVSDVIFVTVIPIPNVNAGVDFSLCNTPIQYTLSGFNPIGGSWSGSGVTSSGIFTPNNIGIVTLTYSIVQGGCLGTDQINITVVNPIIPDAGVNQTLCLGSAPIQLSGTPDGGVWSGGPLVIQEGIFTPSEVGSFSLVYTIGEGSCEVSDEINIQVNALPNVTFALEDTLFCTSDAPITLSSGTPVGGVYSGLGVNGNLFEPSLSIGQSTIGYSFSDFNGCTNVVNEIVNVEICTWLANADKNVKINLYPNPSSGILNIQLSEEFLFTEMTLFSIEGKLIIQKHLNTPNQSFDFSFLKSGVYSIRFQSEETIVSLPWYKFN